MILIGRRFNIFRLESLEGGDINVCDQRVQLVHGVLILVAKTSEANTNAEWNAPEINLWNCFKLRR